MKMKREIIVYADNSLCVDGRMRFKDERFIASLGVDLERQCDRIYNTPDARIVTFSASRQRGKNGCLNYC